MEATVASALNQEQPISQTEPFVSVSDDGVMTRPCPDGGTRTFTFTTSVGSPPPPRPSSEPVVVTMRTEFNDCRIQDVVLRGDPYILISTELPPSPLPLDGTPSLPRETTFTSRTTGAVRAVVGTRELRVQYDCTTAMKISYLVDGSTQVTITPIGTMTWESPPGVVVMTRGCNAGGS